MKTSDPPQNPAGAYAEPGDYSDADRLKYIEQIESFPALLAAAATDLNDDQLDTRYRNWTIRQIIHHLADSHINSYVRYKWALTESTPVIKSYDESLWSEVVDARQAPIDSSLNLLSGLHARWGDLMRRLDDEQWSRAFFHPELDRAVTLRESLPMYAWHSAHHLAQIHWVREQRGWPSGR